MRIAIYWEQESWGGVDSHLLELLSSWPDREDEFVLFFNRGNRGFERIRAEIERLSHVRGIEVWSSSHNEMVRRARGLPGHPVLRGALYVLQPITFALAAWRLARVFAKAGRFDLLLADDGAYPGAWGCVGALLAAKRLGIQARVLLVHHGATRPVPFMGWFERLVDRMVNDTATAVVCVSQATRRSLLEHRVLDAEVLRLRVIHNGISPRGAVTTGAPDLRRELNARDELLVAIVGRVEPYKGHEDLLFALARLEPECRRRLRLVVIGAGDEAEVERLRRLAGRLSVDDQVSFIGYVPGRSIDVIAQLDLLVVATRSFEGFGLTLIEAIQAGTPVLATRVGAIPEFVDESTGTLVNPGAPDELSSALRDFVSNQEAWRRRAASARERATDTGASMAREYRRLFVECMAAR